MNKEDAERLVERREQVWWWHHTRFSKFTEEDIFNVEADVKYEDQSNPIPELWEERN